MSGRRAFSLVELLVVVAVITLLAAIILPTLARAREYAYFTSCKSSQRQIGVGFLIFGSNNAGSVKLSDSRCDRYLGPDYGPNWGGGFGCKIGIQKVANWWKGGAASWGKLVAGNIYAGIDNCYDPSAEDWFGVSKPTWVGKPREPGAYLPIEILWDPILKVRGWGYWGQTGWPLNYDWGDGNKVAYSGTEKERDFLSRAHGIYGYEYFVRHVGCAKYQKDRSFVDHIIKASPYNGSQSSSYAEGPNHRPDTGNRSLRTSAKPSAWVAACHPPHNYAERRMKSHFCSSGTRPTDGTGNFRKGEIFLFRFNVLHIDGHVHDDIWKEPYWNANAWLPGGPSYTYNYRPYGWWLESPAGDGSLKTKPMFEGAFDQNKGEYREVPR
jgi:prepilin-type N-terminal cleavage/methylation domain-containing protein